MLLELLDAALYIMDRVRGTGVNVGSTKNGDESDWDLENECRGYGKFLGIEENCRMARLLRGQSVASCDSRTSILSEMSNLCRRL